MFYNISGLYPMVNPYNIHDSYKSLHISRHCVPSLGRGKNLNFFSFLYFSFILVCFFITLRQDFVETSLFDLELLVPSAGIISVHHHTQLVLFIQSGLAQTLGSSTPPSGGPSNVVSPPLWRVQVTHSFWKKCYLKNMEPISKMPPLSRHLYPSSPAEAVK